MTHASTRTLRSSILARLRRAPIDLRGRVLVPAVRDAHPDELPDLIDAAVQSQHDGAIARAMARAHECDGGVERIAVDGLTTRALRDALKWTTAPAETARLVIDLAARDGTPAGLDVLLDIVLPSRRPPATADGLERAAEVVEHAARVLLDVVDRATAGPERAIEPMACAQLDAALADAARHVREHRATPVLIAIARGMLRPGPALDAVLADDEADVHGAVRGVLERVDEPAVGRALIRWLANEHLGRVAARWWHRIDAPRAVADVLHDAHLLRHPARRRMARYADRALRIVPAIDVVNTLPRRAAVAVPDLLGMLDLAATSRLDRLATFTDATDPLVRWRAVDQLERLGGRARHVVAAFAADAHPVVSHRARRAAGGAVSSPPRHARQRRERSARRAVHGAAEFVERFPHLTDRARRAAAWALAAHDRSAAVSALRDLILPGGGSAVRLAAIRIARRMRLVDAVRDALRLGFDDPEARVASAVVAALGDVALTADDVAALERQLRHPHARVEANAIEALARTRWPLEPRSLAEFAQRARTSRARANAVFGLRMIDRRAALRQAAAMLDTGDALDQISVMWAIRRGRFTELRPRLERLASEAAVPALQRRASIAAHFLAAPLPGRTGAGRAPSLDERAKRAEREGKRILKVELSDLGSVVRPEPFR